MRGSGGRSDATLNHRTESADRNDDAVASVASRRLVRVHAGSEAEWHLFRMGLFLVGVILVLLLKRKKGKTLLLDTLRLLTILRFTINYR